MVLRARKRVHWAYGGSRTKPIVQSARIWLVEGRRPVSRYSLVSRRRFPRWLMAVLIVPLFCMLAVLGMRAWRRSGAEEHWRFTSSGGRFEIVVHRIPSSFAMRGGSSDAP